MTNTKKIGVIGAGTMGTGVTADLLMHGMDTVLVDIDSGQLEKAKVEIAKLLRFAPLLKKDLDRELLASAMDRLTCTENIQDVGGCGFIVENVPEKWEIKEPVYNQLDQICGPETIFGVDTSCISVTKVGGITSRPDKVIGMHFMNPVYLKPVIEVMMGLHTSSETLQTAEAFLADLGKKAIVVGDMPGFVSNRISHLFMNEAAFVLQDQVAVAVDVDQIFKDCFGHKMGPLETADLIGLDVVVDSLNVLYESYKDPKFRVCPLMQKMVDAGHLGRKSGKGFYDYA